MCEACRKKGFGIQPIFFLHFKERLLALIPSLTFNLTHFTCEFDIKYVFIGNECKLFRYSTKAYLLEIDMQLKSINVFFDSIFMCSHRDTHIENGNNQCAVRVIKTRSEYILVIYVDFNIRIWQYFTILALIWNTKFCVNVWDSHTNTTKYCGQQTHTRRTCTKNIENIGVWMIS